MNISGGAYQPLRPERARSPSRKREVIAGIALLVSILGFVLQTEVLGYVSALGYQKPIMVMYVTHSCMITLLPLQFASIWIYRRFSKRETLVDFYQRHKSQLQRTAVQIAEQNGHGSTHTSLYFIKTAAILAISLNIAGASWYIAVNMTSTSDLTAIYNCGTFFAYMFSVLLLHERLGAAKLGAVFLSVLGVVVIAYFGNPQHKETSNAEETRDWRRRTLGNMIIAVGTILYGLYEVLYKKIACPPQRVSTRKQTAFSNLVGAMIGVGTLVLMWPVLLILHFTKLETFEVPSLQVTKYLVLSVIGNVSFSGSFLVLTSLTSPVLGSVSSLLATCAVPVINYIFWHQKVNFAEIAGGLLIIGAFALMTYASLDDFVEDQDNE